MEVRFEEETDLVRKYAGPYLPRFGSVLDSLAKPLRRLRKRGVESYRTQLMIEDGLRKLHPEERSCLILRERFGLTVNEIAEVTGLDPERVRQRILSGREQLRVLIHD